MNTTEKSKSSLSDAAFALWMIAFELIIAGAGFAVGRQSAPTPDEILESAQPEPEVMGWQDIDNAVRWCNARGWDSEPLYDQSYGWTGETNAEQVIGVQCKSYSSNY